MTHPMITIRPERPADIAAIHHVNAAAFAQPQEAELVDALRRAGGLTISLVAVHHGRIVGHIAFSPVTITSDTAVVDAIGLGPMAVLPEWQRQGVGAQLIETGLETCRDTGVGLAVVLGHPGYYPRFGFTPAKPYGIVWEHEAPAEAFMVRALQPEALARTQGVVRYRPEFDRV